MEVKSLEHNFRDFENIKVTTKDKLKINVRFWQAAEATILILLTIIIWGLFSLPAVFYLGQQPVNKVCLCPCRTGVLAVYRYQ